MSTETSAPLYSRTERLPWRKLDNQIVIVNPRSREVHVLSGTGSIIWELLGNKQTLDGLVGKLSQEFTGDPAMVTDDVNGFLQDLTSKGLVAVESAAAARPE